MPVELWYRIAQYFIGVLVVLALLVALMETSRKYDKYHDWPYFVAACGYFSLLVWALLRAMALENGLFGTISSLAQLIGYIALAIGYRSIHQHHQALHQSQSSESNHEGADSGKDKGVQSSQKDWVRLLSAKESDISQAAEEETAEAQLPTTSQMDTITSRQEANKAGSSDESALTQEEQSVEVKPTEASTVISQPKPAPKKSRSKAKISSDDGIVDLSYLAQRNRKKNRIQEQTAPISPADSKETLPALPENNTVIGEPSDQPKKLKKSKKKVERDQMMDELFPLAHPQEKAKLDFMVDTEVLPGETTAIKEETEPEEIKPAKKRSVKSKLPMAIGISTSLNISTLMSALITLAAIGLTVIYTAQERKSRGGQLLMGGFIVLFVAAVLISFYGAPTLINPPFISFDDYIQLLIIALQLIGFVMIGSANWIKIKGKITHHFLVIVSIIYGVLLLLTCGLSAVMVKDETGLQILLLLMTGVLITVLPIIHSLAYNHPQELVPEISHE